MTDLDVIAEDDSRYPALTTAFNPRWRSRPCTVALPTTTDQAAEALRRARADGGAVALQSSGHCFEGFVHRADVRHLIDVSGLDHVGYDAEHDAVVVGAGARIGTVYQRLLHERGVTIPAGQCLSVAAGGHIAGGAYGPLCRQHGLSIDHLTAVEVVVVDESGEPKVVHATSRPDDPARDLWWAHTGGGGGNFGLVTRYWFGGAGGAPLPRPPQHLRTELSMWSWEHLDERAFTTLIHNFGRWHAAHAGADDPAAALFARLLPMHRAYGSVLMDVQIDPAAPKADSVWREFHAEIDRGLPHEPVMRRVETLPWLDAVMALDAYSGSPSVRTDHKSAFLRRPYTDEQVSILYTWLTQDPPLTGVGLGLCSYGGRTNLVRPRETASVQRDSIMKVLYMANWVDEGDDPAHLLWLRGLYAELYAPDGGVPVAGALTDGCSVNYPDIDLDDPNWNTSGTGSDVLYYGANAATLRTVKKSWDPLHAFWTPQGI